MTNSPEEHVSPSTTLTIDSLRKHWQMSLLIAALLYMLWPMLQAWWDNWNKPESYYSHGPLVPLIAAFMVWSNRKVLTATKINPSWWGVVLLLCACPVYVISILMGIKALFPITFYLVTMGLILMLWGRIVLKEVLAPLAFLITMIPFAEWTLDAMTAKAQLLSAAVAEQFLTVTGYEVARYGNQIQSAGLPEPLLVGSPCSGLRLLISLITFSWFFTYVIDGPRWKKAILMLLSLPLAVFINSLRITMIGYAGFWTDSSDAMHSFHDYSGYIGLVICFVILFGVARLMKMGQFMSERLPKTGTPNPTATKKPARATALVLAVAVVIVASGTCGAIVKPLYDLPKGKLARNDIPVAFGTWTSQSSPIHPAVKKQLSMGDLLDRQYVDRGDSGREVEVFMDASLDILAFHDPHLCLPGGGNLITNEKEILIKFTKPRPITVRATSLESSNDYGKALIIYWYMLGDHSYAGTPELWTFRRNAMKNDLIRLVANPFRIQELRADIQSRQIVWYRFSTTMITEDSKDQQFLIGFIRDFIDKHRTFGQ